MIYRSKGTLSGGWHIVDINDGYRILDENMQEAVDDLIEHCELRGNDFITMLIDTRMCLVCEKSGEWVGLYEVDANHYCYIHSKCPRCGYCHIDRRGKSAQK